MSTPQEILLISAASKGADQPAHVHIRVFLRGSADASLHISIDLSIWKLEVCNCSSPKGSISEMPFCFFFFTLNTVPRISFFFM